jgi:hypothetical protein
MNTRILVQWYWWELYKSTKSSKHRVTFLVPLDLNLGMTHMPNSHFSNALRSTNVECFLFFLKICQFRFRKHNLGSTLLCTTNDDQLFFFLMFSYFSISHHYLCQCQIKFKLTYIFMNTKRHMLSFFHIHVCG